MSLFDPELAEIRFGCGLSPTVEPPRDVSDMLSGLNQMDDANTVFPIETYDQFRNRMITVQKQARLRRKARSTDEKTIYSKKIRLLKSEARRAQHRWLGQTLLRCAHTNFGFCERIAYFWSDHFTARGKSGILRHATSPYIESAIRPNLSGRFADLLIACVSHPVMLDYLDQHRSVGPNSRTAQRRKDGRGLNENLAREVLELHSLGVDGPYGQADVRQLAELFTGMTHNPTDGFVFRQNFSEPGSETVLGKRYGDKADFDVVRDALNDLATHPITARHIARKLAVHFVSDTPEPDLVNHIADRFVATDGMLSEVYAAMFEHPAAWAKKLQNAKLPIDFIGSACRALAISKSHFSDTDDKQIRQGLTKPLEAMGQAWQNPIGPDGWSEFDSDWLTPPGLSARIDWAMRIPQFLVPELPDPRIFVQTALGSYASERVRFAASAAESKSEAIGLVLACPAFQRR